MNHAVKPLPIGISDYKKIIENGCYYVDKTLLIQELLSVKDEVTLLCRPRRFGKTINLSMLQYFFEKTSKSHEYLFTDKLVWQDEGAREHQGKYPVIFVSFKDVKEKTFESAYKKVINLIIDEFKRHESALLNNLDPDEHKKYRAFVEKTADQVDYAMSLLFLSQLLHKAYTRPVIVLLDEYDAPIHAAYVHGYYREMIDFMRGLYSAVLKDNAYLERGVLTGILRTAKEGIFSGLNNLTVCTLLSNEYSDKFGFTEPEVTKLLADQQVAVPVQDITAWYNGYRAGENTLLYNPWSILQCAKSKGQLMPYWANTSSNDVIRSSIAQATGTVKSDLESLLIGTAVTKIIEEAFTFDSVSNTSDAVWSLLLHSGYLTYKKRIITSSGQYSCDLVFPNIEIEQLYRGLISELFAQALTDSAHVKDLVRALVRGDAQVVQFLLQHFVINSMSFHDIDSAQPERSYHLFVLGLLVTLTGVYTVRSNRESGFGRYDIMLIPEDKKQPGVIIEFKRADFQDIEKTAEGALQQIQERAYASELHAQGVTTVISYGIAFQGKQVLVKKEQ